MAVAADEDTDRAGTSAPFLLREGVLLAWIPVLGYGVAYAFAVGEAWQFGIPLGFVAVNLDSIFFAVGKIIGPLGIIYLVCNPLLMLIPSNVLVNLVTRTEIVLLGYSLIFLTVTRPGYWWWVGVLGAQLFILLLSWGIAMAAQKGVKGFWNRFKAAAHTKPEVRETGWTWIYQRVGVTNMIALWIVFVLTSLGLAGGTANAIHQKVHPVQVGTHMAVVATYGNTVVLEGFRHNQLTGHFVVRGLTSQPPLVLVSRSIGPLLTPKV